MTDNLFADISSNNAGFTAKSYVEAGHLAVAIKATEGLTYINPKYKPWLTDAHRHKLAVFHYHFARPENGNPDGQAKHFWDTVKPHFKRPGDYVVVDVETGGSAAKAWTTEFDRHLTKISGTHPVLYTFLAMYNEQHLTIGSDRVWIAAWGANNPAGADWKLGAHQLWAWQYTDGVNGPPPHSFAGIPGTCDGSRLNPKTTQQIRSQLHH
jgi:lysozyme